MATTLELLNAAQLAFYNNKPVARLVAPSGVSVPNNSLAAIGLTSSTIDNWSGHSNVTNPSRYTIPVAGKYTLAASVSFSQNSTGYRLAAFALNGAEIPNTRVYVGSPSASVICTIVMPTILLPCVVGDYVEFYVFQNSGGALNTDNGSGGPGGVQFTITYESQ